jgi:hypothetical protein
VAAPYGAVRVCPLAKCGSMKELKSKSLPQNSQTKERADRGRLIDTSSNPAKHFSELDHRSFGRTCSVKNLKKPSWSGPTWWNQMCV